MGPIFRLGNRPRFIALWIAAGVIFKSLAAWETVTNLSVSILGVIFSETEFLREDVASNSCCCRGSIST